MQLGREIVSSILIHFNTRGKRTITISEISASCGTMDGAQGSDSSDGLTVQGSLQNTDSSGPPDSDHQPDRI